MMPELPSFPGVEDSGRPRRSGLREIGLLALLCVVAGLVAIGGAVQLITGPATAWRAWLFGPFVGGALRPLPVLAVLALLTLRRGQWRAASRAAVATAAVVVVASLAVAAVQTAGRYAIRPALLRQAAGVVAPAGVVVSGRPHLVRVTNDYVFHGPNGSGGPEATWFWPLSPGGTSACGALRAAYGTRLGWDFDVASCSAFRRVRTGRVRAEVVAFDRAHPPGYLAGSPDAPSGPGIRVVTAPDDDAPME